MRTTVLLAALATGALSLTASPAVAAEPAFDCDIANVRQNESGGFDAVVTGWAFDSDGDPVSIRCYWPWGSTPTGSGTAFALTTGDITYTSAPVALCAVVNGVSVACFGRVPHGVALPLPLPGETAPVYSATCDMRVTDTTVQTVRVAVYLRQPSADETHVCVRVEDAVTRVGAGGRFVVTTGDPGVDPGSAGLPSADGNGGACTATTSPPNQVPGTHPAASVGLPGATVVADAYSDGSATWVCLTVAELGASHRVVVPLDPPDPTVGPLPDVAFQQDPPA